VDFGTLNDKAIKGLTYLSKMVNRSYLYIHELLLEYLMANRYCTAHRETWVPMGPTDQGLSLFFFYVASTYWKPASTTPLLDLPMVGVVTFLKVVEAPLCYLIQVRSTVLQDWRHVFTPTSWTYTPEARCSTSCAHWRGFFLDPRTPYATSAVPWLRFTST
jgi:hypothetical protein